MIPHVYNEREERTREEQMRAAMLVSRYSDRLYSSFLFCFLA